MLTIFDERLDLNLKGVERNVEYMLDAGIDESNGFFVVNGSTGECYAMTIDEQKKVIERVVEVVGGSAPVIAGCNETSVSNVIHLAKHSERVGADAVLIVQPHYLNFTDDQVFNFYKYINDQINLPIMIYNNPSIANGSDLSINTLKRLAKLNNVFALKEASTVIKRVFHTQVLTDELLVFASSSSLQPFGNLAKMNGFISFIASFYPRLQIDLWKAICDEDYKQAQKLHTEELVLYDWWWRGGIKQTLGQVVHAKKALELLGLEGGSLRPPLLPLDDEQVDKLTQILEQWNLLKS